MPKQSNRQPRLTVERVVSAGGVVYRRRNGSIEVLLCHRLSPVLWCLPKGTPDDGESIAETALREVREETGVEPQIVGNLGSIQYSFTRPQQGRRFEKTVHHYLMTPIGGDPSLHDHEFDQVEWVELSEAIQRLTHKEEAEVAERARVTIAKSGLGAPS